MDGWVDGWENRFLHCFQLLEGKMRSKAFYFGGKLVYRL